MDVPVEINKLVFDYDQVIIVGPVFPHEVVGFSGGNKYLFPGIGGPEILNFFHWLGAVSHQPDDHRQQVDAGAQGGGPRGRAWSSWTSSASALVVAPDKSLAGLFAGTPEDAWDAASDLSRQVHITYKDQAVQHRALLRAADVRRHLDRRASACTSSSRSWPTAANSSSTRRTSRDLRHARQAHRGDRLPLPRLLPQAVGQVQALSLGRAGALDARARHRHVRERRREVPRAGHARHRHPRGHLPRRSTSATATRRPSAPRNSPTARTKASCSCPKPAKCSITSTNNRSGRAAVEREHQPGLTPPGCARFAMC